MIKYKPREKYDQWANTFRTHVVSTELDYPNLISFEVKGVIMFRYSDDLIYTIQRKTRNLRKILKCEKYEKLFPNTYTKLFKNVYPDNPFKI